MTTKRTIRFETATCDRCGGTGQMPYAAYGGVCFSCNGQKVKMTRKGAAARKAYYAARAAACEPTTLGAVEVGQTISRDGGRTWLTVGEVLTEGTGAQIFNGERIPMITVRTIKGNGVSGLPTDAVLIWSAEAGEAAIQRVAKMSGATITTKET